MVTLLQKRMMAGPVTHQKPIADFITAFLPPM